MSEHLRPAVLTYHCQFLLHGLSDHVGRGDVFNPQRRINGFMFFSLSVLNLEDHLGLVISPQSPLSAGYITLRACRRSLPLRFSAVTPGGIVGFLIVSYRFNIPNRLVVHLSVHARPELRAHYKSCHSPNAYLGLGQRTGVQGNLDWQKKAFRHRNSVVFGIQSEMLVQRASSGARSCYVRRIHPDLSYRARFFDSRKPYRFQATVV